MFLTFSHLVVPGSGPQCKLPIAVFQHHINVDLTVSTVRKTPVCVEHVCGLGLILLDSVTQALKKKSHRYTTELCKSRNDDVFASNGGPTLLMPGFRMPYEVILRRV
jgi:hypothetical protein